MDLFETLGDPVRRSIVEELAAGEQSAGELTAMAQVRFGISQPAVSQHLRILRERGYVTTRAEGTRRIYRLSADPFADLRLWLGRYDRLWSGALDDLGTYLNRPDPGTTNDRERDHV
ncbi:MAG TPA: metalloregulator ArsR/SmtB family transcription factor [Thermomicrobiales bacterium]|nr:metalloregulator ArsR/SmtB family transcription factor [Thermomicrobiales bacterium]